jgi:ligand-binding sensor domain-containing protein
VQEPGGRHGLLPGKVQSLKRRTVKGCHVSRSTVVLGCKAATHVQMAHSFSVAALIAISVGVPATSAAQAQIPAHVRVMTKSEQGSGQRRTQCRGSRAYVQRCACSGRLSKG